MKKLNASVQKNEQRSKQEKRDGNDGPTITLQKGNTHLRKEENELQKLRMSGRVRIPGIERNTSTRH